MLPRIPAILGVLALAATTASPLAPAARAQSLSPRNANYTIRARLDPQTRTITGEERLAWRNTSSIPATTLQFHLYYNAWRNTRSTWMRERRLAGADPSIFTRPEQEWGWIDISALRIGAAGVAPDVVSRARFIAPDDGNPDDRTVMEVPLDQPVPPGGSVDVDIAWSAHVPRTFARTGAIGDFYFIAQWFPKIGVLQDTGWNTHQFHAGTEFFADFGTYDVHLTVPRGWVVGATGVEQDRADGSDGTTTHHYAQADVHDFAWTTSPSYIERRATFQDPSLPKVEMRLLLQPEHASQAERHFAATRAALKYYGQWFGPYPYGHITIVDPAWQSDADGMEYPTLFTAGSNWIAPPDGGDPEGVTVHEAGHQFWYGIVATNEFEDGWMDEGFNTYSEARTESVGLAPTYYTKRYFGGLVPWVFRDIPMSREIDGNRLSGYRRAAKTDVQSTPTWRYWPGSGGAITYNKTALWLNTLERMLGWTTQQRILSTYFSRWAFRHPKPDDFFAVANEVSGRDLGWFFDQVYRGSNVFDYGIDVFRSREPREAGLFGTPGRPVPTRLAEASYHTTLMVRRYGEAIFPVDVRVVFEDGQEKRWQWDGRDRWKLFEVDARSRAAYAQVDPVRVLLLDVNYTNNSATLSPNGPAAARKWSLAWLVWMQDHLLTYGFFV